MTPSKKPTHPLSGSSLSGAEIVVQLLADEGTDVVFGYSGGAILPTYDAIFRFNREHKRADGSDRMPLIVPANEQAAGFMAAGYARASGKVGVCMATSGPGATNLVTAIADAHMDSVPMVAITGQVASSSIGTDAFQEADIRGITMPITKHNYLVTDAAQIPRVVAEAFHVASTGRPGPVLVDIAKDALQARTTFDWPPRFDLPGYHPVTRPHAKQIREAARLIAQSRQPVLYVGGGVIRGRAHEELRRFVDLTGIPVVTTLMARGAFPDSHELHLGMPGMHGSVAAVTAFQKADLLITLGARFDDRVTGALESFAPHAKVIHADIDPAEIGKNRTADVPIVGDVKVVLDELTEAVAADRDGDGRTPDISAWVRRTQGWKRTFPVGYETSSDPEHLHPQYVIERLGELSGPDAFYASGVGQHQMWAAQLIRYERPNAWLNSGGAGTMGYSVPAAMGAKAANPEAVVWAIDGDGCFQMTNQELATCVINDIPIKVAIINNSSLGMVRQWQSLFYDKRYSNTDLHTSIGSRIPDFVMMAEAYGCLGLRCERPEDVDDVIRQALECNDRPVVIDFVVERDAMVWPMVPAGLSNDLIQVAKDTAPDWDREESEAIEQAEDADHDGE